MNELTDLQQAYREVFSSPEGRAVLTDILNDCGFFSDVFESVSDMARRNVAQRLAIKAGLIDPTDLFGTVDKLIGREK